MRYTLQRLLPVLSLWAPILGCASSGAGSDGYVQPSSPSASMYVSSSSSIGSMSSSGGSEAYIPSRDGVKADLIVRPDMALIDFALREVQADPHKGLASLKMEVAEAEKRFKEVAPGAVSVRMCGVSVSPVASGKAASSDDAPAYAVVVDGKIEIGLAPDLDYWAKSQLVASLTQVMKELAARAHKDGEKKREGASARFEGPKVVVKSPEMYRAKIVEQWVKRSRYYADAAQTTNALQYRIDCAPPAEVEQKPISLEEVGLTLPVTCRLEAIPTAATK